jgi:Aminoglycoside-2''-adenylyltransferase
VQAPWYVAAGWAIDLFLGGEYREHDDLEIAVPRDRFHEIVEALAGFELFVGGAPRHGLVSPLEQARDALDAIHQTWVREPETGLWGWTSWASPPTAICGSAPRRAHPAAV